MRFIWSRTKFMLVHFHKTNLGLLAVDHKLQMSHLGFKNGH